MGSIRTVWMLGAGFSRALGGPLIGDLLRFRDESALNSLLPRPRYGELADTTLKARAFFAYGRDQGYWDHAEQFLDVVETAASESVGEVSSQARSLVVSMLGGGVLYAQREHRFASVGDLATAARRAVAADCSLFLRSAEPKTERWDPYMRWARQLSGSDTVVTFNYDRVPEILQASGGRLAVIPPDRDASLVQRQIATARGNVAPVLKLHGSVTWVQEGEEFKVVDAHDTALIHAQCSDVVLGIPGPGKREACRRLALLWEEAETAIRTAQKLIFIGYRFPPSDSDSRRRVIEAMRFAKLRDMDVEVVLGPDLRQPDTVRMLHLLGTVQDQTGSGVRPEGIPLYAEDYLSLWTAPS